MESRATLERDWRLDDRTLTKPRARLSYINQNLSFLLTQALRHMMLILHEYTGIFQVQERDIVPSKTCPNNTSNVYTTQDGLSFDLYCGHKIVSDSLGSAPHSNIMACIENCSVYRPRCYGVSYDTNTGDCEFKDQPDVSPKNITSDSNANSAIAHAAQLASPRNVSCPFSPNSYQYTKQGQQFEILCDLDMPYGDYRPTNVPYAPYHADSLQECMELCSTSQPLCVGVAWNPDLQAGYANCYPKSSQAGTPSAPKKFTVHSALWRDNGRNVSCPGDTTNPTSIDRNGKNFEISCNSGRLGGSNTSYHDNSFDGCVSTCATNSSQNCLGVVYDGSLQGGYSNCYLLNATGEPTSIANSTYALFTQSESNSTTTPPPPSKSSSSKAWIAGPAIGAVLLIAALVGFLLWRRRKRSAKVENLTTVHDSTDYKQLGQTPYRSNPVDEALDTGSYTPYKPDPQHELHELGKNAPYKSTPLHELHDTRGDLVELEPGLKPPSQNHEELYDQHGNAHELG